MFSRRTLLYGVAAIAVFALAVTAGKGGGGKPPPEPPPADPAILYLVGLGTEGEIWVMNADGTNQAPVITASADGISPAQGTQSWSGDNTRFVFTGRVGDGTTGLYVCDVAGLYPQRIHTLINDGRPVQVRPDWAPTPLPDQQAGEDWIVFADGPKGEYPSHLYAIALRSDGTTRGPFNLTSGLEGTWREEPSVSFDGTRVAYRRDDNQIYVGTIGTDGDGNPVITSEDCVTDSFGGLWFWPTFDPTGEYLVAKGAPPSSSYDLWVIPIGNPAGAWALFADDGGTVTVNCPTWLDEQTVAFERIQQKPQLYDLRAVDIATLEVTLLASSKQVSRRRPAARRYWPE